MDNPIFVIRTETDSKVTLKGTTGERVNVVRFHGTADSAYFHGEVLAGGTECRRQKEPEPLRSRAGFVLSGTDCADRQCSIYIENDGRETPEGMRTVPDILTDSEILSGLTHGTLYGEISEMGADMSEIRIYEKKEPFTREAYCIRKGDKQIYGELYRPAARRDCPLLIMSHGFNGSSAGMRVEAECMAGRGVAVYCYDFCSGGLNSKSSGSTTEMTIPSEQEDLKIVVGQMKTLDWVNKDRIYLFGSSQGGFVTALTAPDLPGIAGIFLEFPAFCIPDDWLKRKGTISESGIEFMGVPLGRCYADTVPEYDVFEKAAEYTGPVIVFHGTEDSLVSIRYSEKLCRSYRNSRLIRFPGQEHGFTEPFITAMAGICTEAMCGHAQS